MASTPHLRFAARMESMGEIQSYVDRACAEAGLGRDHALRLLLIIEELFTNSVMHGYGGESDSPVWLSLEAGANAVTLSYQDEGPAHDPLTSFRPMETTTLVSQQPVGGLGVKLIRKLAKDISYRREQNRNCIRVTLSTGGGA